MNYWQAMPGNLNESMMAFFDYFDAHIEDFRYNARQLWGCRGIYIPPFMVPANPITVENQAHTINYTEAAGWLASFYYDYYLFTGDEDFLKNRAVPFLKEVALFYEDFIIGGRLNSEQTEVDGKRSQRWASKVAAQLEQKAANQEVK